MERRIVIVGMLSLRRVVITLQLLCTATVALAQSDTVVDGGSPPAAAEPAPSEPPVKPLKALPENFGEAVGTWDLSLDGSNRRCVLTLASDNGANGRVLRFPAGCRRALPILGETVGWLFADGGIRLVDRNIRPLLQFSARADKHSLIARSDHGDSFSLVPLQTLGMMSEPIPSDGAVALNTPATTTDVATLREIPGSQPVLPADVLVPPGRPTHQSETPSPAPTPGLYALDRFEQKDVCRIELGSSDKTEGAPATLLPGCRDNGITTFDPDSWRFANGHMTLRSKRGHAVNLVTTGAGSWRRDPDVGTTFVLRKVEP